MNKLFAHLIAAALMLISQNSFADLSDNIITLDHDKDMFHWTPKDRIIGRSKTKSPDGMITKEQLLKYAQNTAAYQSDIIPRNGLYFALDPVVSANWGTNDGLQYKKADLVGSSEWVLVKFTFKKDQKILDMPSVPNPSTAERKWFRDRNCVIVGQDSMYNKSCGKAFHQYLKMHNIVGVLYEWRQERFPFCTNEAPGAGRAFILKDASLLDNNTVTYYSPSGADNDMSEVDKSLVARLWKDANYVSHRIESPFQKWPLSDDQSIQEYADKFLLDCRKGK